MRSLLFLGCLFACQNPQTPIESALLPDAPPLVHNFLQGTRWKSNGSCFTADNHERVELSAIDTSNFFASRWGYFIEFDSSRYLSYYSAQCGMDCFTSVEGTYRFIGDSTAHITVESITRRGICGDQQGTMEVKNPRTSYRYQIEKNDKNLTFRLK